MGELRPRASRLRWQTALLLVGLAGALVALRHRSQLQAWAYGLNSAAAGLVGKPAPELPSALKTVESAAPVRLKDLRGRVILLHFWTFD